ncbi:hypothetical protein [Methylobacterium aquaticum]|uniref:hypothetical protein n=1 Tax=Methylobacterium aquaticum TaxID=270351 RepID=UPI001933DA8E|nr:hypothetical protein [Methylobacterium aquaticum]QRE76518.1 hypothetical protein F1D61_25715 [Methylobacterium aquaticum]
MSEQITLGALIDALDRAEQDEMIRYDFGGFLPVRPVSYRGFYDHLAIGFVEHHDAEGLLKVADLLAACRTADGATFQGYKGGSYTMNRDTPLWAANYGASTDTAIVGLKRASWGYVIETVFME